MKVDGLRRALYRAGKAVTLNADETTMMSSVRS